MLLCRCALAVALAAVGVVATAMPSSSDDATVTWDQVRAALAAQGHVPSHPMHPGGSSTPPGVDEPVASGTMTVIVTIPDLSWAIDDPTASASIRRAACHQATGLDDETAAPLAACLAHVRGDENGRGPDDVRQTPSGPPPRH
jgi:hypothetical protein